jgi:predicted aspartyl protease
VDAETGPGSWRTLQFLVDTGSSHTTISADAARDAGLTVVPGARLLTPSGTVDASVATLRTLRIGNRTRTAVPVVVADLVGRERRLDGLLGMDVLGAEPVLIDLEHERLTFLDPAGPRTPRGGTRLPARTVDGRLIVDARVDGRAHRLVLDSGAAVTVVFDQSPTGRPVAIRTAIGAAHARAARAHVTLGGLRLGILQAVKVPAPPGRTGSDGLLPAALFAQVYIDRAAEDVRVVMRD